MFSSKLPLAPPMLTAMSLPKTCAQAMVNASHCVGLTLPGPIELPGTQLVEWGGALRWYRPSAEAIAALSGTAPAAPQTAAQALRERIAALGGTATLFRADEAHADVLRFHLLAPVNLQVHQRLKQTFDPHRLINHGRMYPGL